MECGNIMQKSEKLILKSFIEMKTPQDFNLGIENITLVDSVHGLVMRFYSGEIIEKHELDMYNIDSESKERISRFVSKSIDNLIFYNLIKSCLLIMYKYSK
jgi:hypothetical protein